MLAAYEPEQRFVIDTSEPIVEVYRDCIYVPVIEPANYWENKDWGIYDRHGKLIEAAAFYRVGKREGQSDVCPLDLSRAPYAPRQRYFYVGNVFNHYGHFLCSTMSRLWALPRYREGSIPLLGHAVGGPPHWFSWSHTRTLFGAAGINYEDFANFDRPTRIRELVVARPSFVECTHAHTTHAHAAHRWGDRLAKTQDVTSPIEMIYLAKTKFRDLPHGMANEVRLVEALQHLGVQIVHPEQLTIPEQVALFRRTRIVMGQVGSALHTNIFNEPRYNQVFVAFNASPHTYSSNHAMFDAINNNKSFYVYAPCEWKNYDDGVARYELNDPQAAAREIVDFARSV